MMYPRLKLARNLLREDGVIFISIDDNEVDNLIKICEELFGEDNVEKMVWQKTDSRVDKNTNAKQINRFKCIHEYIIICYRNKNNTQFSKMLKLPDWKKECKNPDNDKRGPWQSGIISYCEGHKKEDKNSIYYYNIVTPTGKTYTRHWFVTKEDYEKLDKDNRISYPDKGNGVPRLKTFEYEEKEYYMESILRGVGTSSSAKDELLEILSNRDIFSTPKPTKLIMELIRVSSEKNDIILDFFSGSSSSAHAAIRINDQCRENRRFIMVQLPELTEEKSEAYKAGYKNICEIGKERIRRAGDRIVSENQNKEGIGKLDIGFKVFKLDSSNLKSWDSSMENLEKNILEMDTNLKKDRSNEDLLYEILLKSGVELTAKIEEMKVGYNTLYNIGEGALLACLDDKITQDVIDEIPKHKSKYMDTKVIFKEAGFMSDAAKINAIQNLKQFKIEDVRSV